MKFATLTMAFALLALTMMGQFGQAVPDTSIAGPATTTTTHSVRSLRKKKSSDDPKTTPAIQHISLEMVQVFIQGPNEAPSEPTGEEIDFFIDCFIASYDIAKGKSGYTVGFAALGDIGKPSERRELYPGQNGWQGFWSLWTNGMCRFCPGDNYEDDDAWRRGLQEGMSPVERLLTEGPRWQEVFCNMLVNGPFECFHGIEQCIFTLGGSRKLHGSLHA